MKRIDKLPRIEAVALRAHYKACEHQAATLRRKKQHDACLAGYVRKMGKAVNNKGKNTFRGIPFKFAERLVSIFFPSTNTISQ